MMDYTLKDKGSVKQHNTLWERNKVSYLPQFYMCALLVTCVPRFLRSSAL